MQARQRQRQRDLHDFENSWVGIVNSGPVKPCLKMKNVAVSERINPFRACGVSARIESRHHGKLAPVA